MSYVRLDLCDGPECPNCGCADCEILQRPEVAADGPPRWWASGRAQCRHCRTVFAFQDVQPENPTAPRPLSQQTPPPLVHQEPAISVPDPEAGVPYICMRCPKCGSSKVRVTSSPLPIRRHHCKACGHNFKSVEQE